MGVKEDLKSALSKLGIDESHKDYKWFEWVFRYGIMLGSEGEYKVICNDEKEKYYYVSRDGKYIEDQEGNEMTMAKVIAELS